MSLIRTMQINRCGRICFFNLVVAEFDCKYSVCACSLVVVRHIVYCERFSGYRTDVSCFMTEMFLISTIQNNRCGRIYFFPYCLVLPNLNVNIVFVCVALLWCGTLYIVNALAVVEQMCHAVLLKLI